MKVIVTLFLMEIIILKIKFYYNIFDHICGLVVRVPDPEIPGSIPGTTRFPEK
jgi:hypothetical protein